MSRLDPPTYMRRLYLFWEAADAVQARRGEPPLTWEQARRWFEAECEPEDVPGALAPVAASMALQGKDF